MRSSKMMRPEPELEAGGATELEVAAAADFAVPVADLGAEEGAAEPRVEATVGALLPEGARQAGDMA